MTSPKDEEEISDISNSHNLTVADDKYRPIPEFYAGRSIFITGGTGFLGKILIEKLLRSCPDIKKIYILIRPRRGKHIEERLSDLLSTPLFQVIRRENPKQLNKVLPISGDIALEELGISKSDQDMLSEDVSIVFHSAATVRFDEKIKLAVTINMLGTKRLVELCHRMKSLDALIHVSTAYCNCDRAEVSEIIYPAPFNPENIISLMNLLPEDILDELTPTLLGTRPNTYTLTKALAEHIILKEAGNLPVAFVRPSIVISTVKEPFPGWVDNLNGPLGLVAAMSKGLIRTMICQGSNIADVVPADIVINLMITAAWRTASEKEEKPCIYNCSSGYTHSITWNEFVKYALKYVRKHPMERCFWYPSGVLRSNRFLNATHGFLVHYIPSYILDKAAQMAGKKTFMLRIQDKIAKAIECLQYFATHQWLFKDDNVRSLLTKMNENDRDNFDFDVKAINWEKYMEECVLGLRQFFFKEQPESLPESRKRMTRLHYLHEMTKALMVTLSVGLAIAQWKRWQE